jgi:hypothetical protein
VIAGDGAVFGGFTAATGAELLDELVHRPIPTPVARKSTAAAAAMSQIRELNLLTVGCPAGNPPPYTTRGPAVRCACIALHISSRGVRAGGVL